MKLNSHSKTLSALAVALFSVWQLQAQNPATISYQTWNDLLKKYMNTNGAVRYSDFQTDKSTLNDYISYLQTLSPDRLSRKEQMAYWINLYNAETMRLILDHYPVKSIRDITGGNPWDQKVLKIDGKDLSLNDVENILRNNFSDPRIHFAINCASKSCPPLRNEAFTADQLDEQLDEQAKKFINNDDENSISGDHANLSPIFDWYKKDFEKSGGIISFINQYSSVKLQPDAKISFRNYDWSLNEP